MIIRVKVIPGSKEFKVIFKRESNGPYLKIWAKSRPERGKANKELLKELKKLFGDVELISGFNSREKYIKMKHTIKEIEERIESGKKN